MKDNLLVTAAVAYLFAVIAAVAFLWVRIEKEGERE